MAEQAETMEDSVTVTELLLEAQLHPNDPRIAAHTLWRLGDVITEDFSPLVQI
jgi:hypothetical protein